jgi:hypothetical protein
MSRNIFNWACGILSVLIAVWSLKMGLGEESTLFSLNHKHTGYVLLAFWGLVPPAFFWVDWVFFCRGMTTPDRDIAKHTHDLSRNIWLALIALLAILFGINP